MKKTALLTAMIFLLTAFAGCGKEAEEEETKPEEVVTETANETEEPEATPTEAPVPPKDTSEQEALYKTLSEWDFLFSSGAGGWGTDLHFNADGSYSGMYHDSDMGDIGAKYPNGTVYVCNFSGKLQGCKKISEYEYELNLGKLTYENESGTEEIEDGVRYIYSEAYGVAETRTLRCYLPGMPVDELPDGYLTWVANMYFAGYYGADWEYGEDYPEELYFCGLYNEAQDAGFTSSCGCEENRLFIKNRAKLPGLKNKKLDINADGTYYCEDADDGYMVRVTNMCFKEEQGLSIYRDEDREDLVFECLEKTGTGHEPEGIYFKTGEYNNYEDIYNRINGKEAFMAVWSEGSNEDYEWCMIKVYQNVNYTTESTVYTYAYLIEMDPDSEFYGAEQLGLLTTGLSLAGTSDGLSTASSDVPAREITGYVKGDGNGGLLIDEVLWIGWGDEDLIKQYNLTDDDMTNDYYIAEAGDGYERYKVSDDCSIFMQFPEEGSQRLWYTPAEYDRRVSTSSEALLRIMLDDEDRVIFAYEPYRP
ncbi:MAG: hypothetical protein K5686_08625 [Lachnospiraceae bacterium]|nr:hypothetical protein [Lachnospiraceae bacterium]